MKKRKYKKNLKIDLMFTAFVTLGLFTYLITDEFYIFIVIVLSLVILWKIIIFSKRKLVERKINNNFRKSGISDIDKMDGLQFEQYLSAIFKHQGYIVKVTKSTGDYGADLVLSKDNEKIVVQAKRYAKNVGINAIQEITASKAYYQATKAWVVSNSYFTKPAIELAKLNNVELLDRKALISYIVKLNPNDVPSAKQVRETIKPKEIICPRCTSKMVLRNGKNGKFYGCSQFPKCKGTRVV